MTAPSPPFQVERNDRRFNTLAAARYARTRRRLLEDRDDWRLSGTAVFRHQEAAVCLGYMVAGDRSWGTQRGEVTGWNGEEPVDFTVIRSAAGEWTLNGARVPGLDELVDLDFGFTPATNLPQIRRVNLAVGQSAEVPVAWLDVFAGTLSVLPQRYERRTETAYDYRSPTAPYAGLLEVGPAGFISRYPDLWEAEM